MRGRGAASKTQEMEVSRRSPFLAFQKGLGATFYRSRGSSLQKGTPNDASPRCTFTGMMRLSREKIGGGGPEARGAKGSGTRGSGIHLREMGTPVGMGQAGKWPSGHQ